MRKIARISIALGIAYISIVSMLYFIQEKLIFLPTKLMAAYEYSFEYPFEEIFLTAADGAKLNAIHFKTKQPDGLILYFHGNAGNLSRWGEVATFFVAKNFDVIIMDYRTYGKSTGKLSESNLLSDAQLFYDYALKYYKEEDIILYGRSLGTGIVSFLASKNEPSMLILESPYYSMLDVASKRMPFLPVSLLLKYKFKTFQYLQNVSCPIIMFHGTKDRIVPIRSSEKLFDSVTDKTVSFIRIEGGEHNNLIEFTKYREEIARVLQTDHSNRSDDK